MGTDVSRVVIMGVALIMISALIVSAFSIFSCAQKVMQGSETEQTVVAEQPIVTEQIEEDDTVPHESNDIVFNIVIVCFNAIFTIINLWIYRKENKGFHFSYDAFASKVYKLYNYLYHDDAEY